MDDPSLSEHEQRILEEIERNLVEEDSEFVRRVRHAGPRRDAIRLLRFSILAFLVGLGLLVAFTVNIAFGILGFLVMLGGVVGVATSIRSIALGGRAPSALIADVWKRAESRLRDRRSKN